MDCIRVTDIRAYGYTGNLPEERVLGQWFQVDLGLYCDLHLAGRSDRLVDTVDYCGLITTVKALVSQQPYHLLEKLATAIAGVVLDLDDRVEEVEVTLTKLAAPIPDFGGTIVIELRRSRSDFQE